MAKEAAGLFAGIRSMHITQNEEEFDIWTTVQWEATSIRAHRLPKSRAEGIVVHHTVTENFRNFAHPPCGAERYRSFGLMKDIQIWHKRRPRWIDTGYHFVISASGIIMEGRTGTLDAVLNGGRVLSGAHSGNGYANRHFWGIGLEGNFETSDPTAYQISSLVELAAWLSIKGNTQARNIQLHSDYRPTACPGDKMKERLVSVREATRNRKIATM